MWQLCLACEQALGNDSPHAREWNTLVTLAGGSLNLRSGRGSSRSRCSGGRSRTLFGNVLGNYSAAWTRTLNAVEADTTLRRDFSREW